MKKISKHFALKISMFTKSKKANIWFLLLGLIVYGKSLFNGFVWDDIYAIVESPIIKLYNIQTIFGPNIYNDGSFYRPISALYFFTLHLFFNNNAFFYHLVHLTLHVVVVMLLFKLLKKFFTSNIAFVLSSIFLVHPINVEPVSFLSGGQAVIYSLFGLTSLYLILYKKINVLNSVLIVLLFALTILSKEEGLQYILIANLYCLIFQKKYFSKIFLFSFLSGLIYLAVRLAFAHDGFSINNNLFNQSQGIVNANPVSIVHLSFPQKLLTAPLVFFYYLKTFFFPIKLSIDQIWVVTSFDLSVLLLPLTFVILFFCGVVLISLDIYKNRPKLIKSFLFFLLWFLIGIGIHIPILQPFNMTVADRWFYFPEIGLLGLLAIIYLKQPIKISLKFLTFLCFIIIFLLSLRSHIRSLNFHDNLTLFEHDSHVYNNSLIEQNIGYFYLEKNNLPLAIEHTAKSVNMFPTTDNLLNLAIDLEIVNRLAEAEVYYQKAYEKEHFMLSRGEHPETVYFYYSRFLLRTRRPMKALELSSEGLKSYPDSDELHIISAVSKYVTGDNTGALTEVDAAIKIFPENKKYTDIYNSILNNQKLENPI